jgi:hypothetical protein
MVANCTLERSQNETSIEYYGLKPGTFYTVVMYTMVADLVSEAGPNITTYTSKFIIVILFANLSEMSLKHNRFTFSF